MAERLWLSRHCFREECCRPETATDLRADPAPTRRLVHLRAAPGRFLRDERGLFGISRVTTHTVVGRPLSLGAGKQIRNDVTRQHRHADRTGERKGKPALQFRSWPGRWGVDLEQAFRCRLRQHRQAAGMTQEPLAEPVGISTKTIERGVVASPFDAVERIASALQRSPCPLRSRR
jgi:hypothetical protein